MGEAGPAEIPTERGGNLRTPGTRSGSLLARESQPDPHTLPRRNPSLSPRRPPGSHPRLWLARLQNSRRRLVLFKRRIPRETGGRN
jgi:hypothetical protein